VSSLHATPPSSDAAQRLAAVRRRIADACDRVGRPATSVILVAVGKTHPPEAISELVALGVRDIAENRVEELVAKQGLVPEATWHMVGQVQRRKARDLVGRRVLVHSLDRSALADTLSDRAHHAGVVQRVLVQVNVGQDPAKSGVAPDEALDLVAYARDRPHLSVEGLMTIPPMPPDGVDPGEAARPHFARLRELRDRARERWPEVTHLSMGMSEDFDVAIEEGATMVRVGTALFGARHDGPWRPAGGHP
jgi:PLP dependent protein